MYRDDLLDDMITKRVKELEDLDAGSVERSRAVSDLTNLLSERRNRKKDEESRMDKDHDDYVASKREEANRIIEEEKRENERKDRRWKRWIEGAGIFISLLSLGTSAILTKKVLKFEYDQGNPSGFMGKQILSSIRPRTK